MVTLSLTGSIPMTPALARSPGMSTMPAAIAALGVMAGRAMLRAAIAKVPLSARREP